MKKIFSVIILSGLSFIAIAQNKTTPAKTTPTKASPIKTTATAPKIAAKTTPAPIVKKPLTVVDTASYGFGVSLGGNLKMSGVKTLNFELVSQGIIDSFKDTELKFTSEQIQSAIKNVFEALSKEKFASIIAENQKFFEQNKTQEGVKSTESGIQYQIIKEGNGIKPTLVDTVTVHYKGSLLDGREFDSSYERQQPATFPLNKVIPGWSESVMLMNEGAIYRVWIPADLGYGERGAGEDIPPYSTLIFEIELIKVSKPQN